MKTSISEQENRTFRLVVKGDLSADGPVLVFGVVYAPGPVDTDQAIMTADNVEALAYEFVASGKLANIDLMHNEKPTGSVVVDSTIIRWENPHFPLGAWVIGVLVSDPALKLAIKNGELNGFSFGGTAFEVQRFALVIQPLKSYGTVEPSTAPGIPEHVHDLELHYDQFGNIVPTRTSVDLGHDHEAGYGTATKTSLGHAHRTKIGAPKLDEAALAA